MIYFSQTHRRLLLLLMILAGICQSAQAQLLTGEELIKSEGRTWDQGYRLRNFKPVNYGYDVHHQTLRLKLNPRKSADLEGRVSVDFRAIRPLDTLIVDLRDNLTVHSITQGGIPLTYRHIEHRLHIELPLTLPAGAYDSVLIHYSGNPERGSGFGYYVRDRHQTDDIIHTLSQPYGAPYWWPCKNSLSDKLDSVDIIVSTASGLRVASNGLLVEERNLNDSEVVFGWKHRYPIAPYLVAIAVSNYIPFTDHAHFHNRPDSLPVLNYVFPQSFSSARVETQVTLPMLRLFDSLFGEYPFMREKYGHAQFTWGGGMEHQTMSFMVNFSFDLTAHELAHMWFGDAVTCGSWRDLWLNEGWATYGNALCYEFLKGPFEFRSRIRDMQRFVKNQPDGSVFPTDTQNISRLFDGRLTYNKAALLLHMLRWQIGDSAFFAGTRNFMASPSHRYGYARTEHFRAFMEDASDTDLQPFFRQWYIGEGYPTFHIDWFMSGNTLRTRIRQSTSHPSVSFYNIKIPVLFRGIPHDTLLIFEPTNREAQFETQLNTQVEDAVFDPDNWLLAESVITGRNANTPLANDIQLYPNPAREKLYVYAKMQRVSHIEIFDMAGRSVHMQGMNTTLNGGEIDLRNFRKGLYVIRVTASGNTFFAKFEVI
jgi:aminopeptidase N